MSLLSPGSRRLSPYTMSVVAIISVAFSLLRFAELRKSNPTHDMRGFNGL